jgi:hypothetical protein
MIGKEEAYGNRDKKDTQVGCYVEDKYCVEGGFILWFTEPYSMLVFVTD